MELLVIAYQERRGEYVKDFCTYRPSRSGRWVIAGRVFAFLYLEVQGSKGICWLERSRNKVAARERVAGENYVEDLLKNFCWY